MPSAGAEELLVDEPESELPLNPFGLSFIACNCGKKRWVDFALTTNSLSESIAKIESLGLETVNPLSSNLVETISAKTNEAMADVVFEVSGVQPGVDAMTTIANVRGRIVVVGIHPQPRQIDLFRFFWSELELIGTRLYEEEDFDAAIALMGECKLPLDELITEVYPIESVQAAFEAIESAPEGIKTLIRCDGK